MNERIRELIAQESQHPHHTNYNINLKRFAELIVKECLDQLLVSDPTEDFDKGIAWSAKQIKQHFGVK